MLPAIRHPVPLAHSLATLDVLSGGRLVIGAGVGGAFTPGQEQDWTAAGVDPKTRAGRLTEMVQVMKRLWSEDDVWFEGRHFRMLGEEIVFFRKKDGSAVAIQDVCPHRGARFSEGHIHWPGTITCPYHGWVFDEQGKNIMVLSEGPDSKVCGKQGTEAYVYPTVTLKGVVFAWIGDTKPAPVEEDIPPEFFDPKAYITWNDHVIWPTNWLVALENAMDSHVAYLHRDNVQALLAADIAAPPGAPGFRPIFTGNGFRYGMPPGAAATGAGAFNSLEKFHYYEGGYKWPKSNVRRWWNWLFVIPFSLMRVPDPPMRGKDWWGWGPGHRLPGMVRAWVPQPPRKGLRILSFFRKAGSDMFGQYTRWPVALEPWKTRLWYFHYTAPSNPLARLYHKLVYNTWARWVVEYNLSIQDGSMMLNQRYDWPEKLSGHDAEVIQWRRLVVAKAFGGRYAPYGYDHERDGQDIDDRAVATPGGSSNQEAATNEPAAG